MPSYYADSVEIPAPVGYESEDAVVAPDLFSWAIRELHRTHLAYTYIHIRLYSVYS